MVLDGEYKHQCIEQIKYCDTLSDYLVLSAHSWATVADSSSRKTMFHPTNNQIFTVWKHNEGITTLPCPPQSPDLNPMKNLLGIIAAGIGTSCVTE